MKSVPSPPLPSDPGRRVLRPAAPPSRRARLAIVLRIAPAVVLVVGLFAWSSWHSRASAQTGNNPYGFGPPPSYPSTGFGNQGFNQYGNNPAAQVAALPGDQRGGLSIPPATALDAIGGEPNDAPESSWQVPVVFQKIAAGGWLMVPLGVCSLLVFGLTMERLIALRRSRVIPKPFVRRFTECVEDGQLSYEEATAICEEFDSPVAEVFQAAVRRWGRPMLEIEQAVFDAGDRVGDSLKRFLRVFHAISNVAPLIGLLGTVLGMIQAFETMADPSASGPGGTLAAGISTALMTTAGGLTVAIPAYLAYMYFGAKSDGYLGEIDKLCQRVIDCISAEGLESNGGAKSARKRRAA